MNAYIFDVDGVITDPEKRVIVHPEIITLIIKLLQKNNPVAFISGRALPWLKERVIEKLQEYIQDNQIDSQLLDNVYTSGEFGGSTLLFQNGQVSEHVNEDIRLNSELLKLVTETTKQFSDIVFVDEDKQTQFTVEMQHSITIDEFLKKRTEIADTYRKLVEELKLGELLEVHEDRIAINIKYKQSNKSFATKQFLDWLSYKNLHPKKFKAFGDSISDLEIGDELKINNLPFDFIYVGVPQDAISKTSFPIIFTKEKFGKELDEGTLDYLKQE